MKYLKTFEIFQDFESEDLVIALPNIPLDSLYKKKFFTTNVGKVINSTKNMIKIKYEINPNSPENGYILDDQEIILQKKYFRFATPEEIKQYKININTNKYNL